MRDVDAEIHALDALDEDVAQDWVELTDSIDYLIPFPGVAQDIQQWILDTSIYPQPAIAYAATMATLSAAYGRYLRYQNIKGNLMFICLAESGEGKDWPFAAAKLLLSSVGLADIVHGQMASGAALMEALQETPSMLLHIDEFGNYLNAISGKKASVYAHEIVDILTKSYTDADKSIAGKRCKGTPPIRVIEPNVCVFGMSTERQTLESLSTSDIANGSIARYSIHFGQKGLMPTRNKQISIVPESIKNGLRNEYDKHYKDIKLSSTELVISDEYDDYKWSLMNQMKALGNAQYKNNSDNDAFIPIYNRIVYRATQCAMLIDQCQDTNILDWFFNIEKQSCDIFIKKFKHLGADNENEKQSKFLQARIKQAGKDGISSRDLTRKTQKIATWSRKEMIRELLDTGLIYAREIRVPGSNKSTTIYYWRR